MDVSEQMFVAAPPSPAPAKAPRAPRAPAAPRAGGPSMSKRAALAKRTVAPAPAEKKDKKAPGVEPVKVKKPRKFSEPVRMHRACKEAMGATTMLLPRAAVDRIIREITAEFAASDDSLRWTEAAKFALHLGLEAFGVEFFSEINVLASHAGRVAPLPIDVKVRKVVQQECKGGNVVMNGVALGKLEEQLGRELYKRE